MPEHEPGEATHRAAQSSPTAPAWRPETGASAVEFALVLPILVLFVFGIIDFGVLFAQVLSLNNAARDAARFGVVRQIDGTSSRTCYDVLARARNQVGTLALTPDSVAVTVTLSGTTRCSIAAGTPLPASANTPALQTAPCSGSVSGTGDQLQVQATTASTPIVPMPWATTFMLSGNGYFRCEYS